MAKSMKNEMVTMVNGLATNVDGNVFEMTAKNFKKLDVEIGNGAFDGKFVVVKNNKVENMYAVVYKTKKSDRIVVIKVVKAEKKVTKKNGFGFSFSMQNDRGLDCHFCEFEMVSANKKTLKDFLNCLNEKLKNSELGDLGASAIYDMIDDVENGFAGRIVFIKIKGHSKDGYALYKKLLVEAKREFKAA
jgi:hypothetical protein